jgi:hypothetical protein
MSDSNYVAMNKILMLIVCSMLVTTLWAQQNEEKNLIIHKPFLMDSLLVQDSIFRVSHKQEGFRIQIFMESGNEAVNRANEVIDQFKEDFPDIPTYLSFGQPYYRIRVGDFRNRIEAERSLRMINKLYSQAFITKDMIEPPVLPFFPETTKTQHDEQSNPFGD